MIARQQLNLFETIRFLEHDLDFEPFAECQPTAAFPGSLEKMQVMCGRLARGEELHHENDAKTAATVEAQSEMGTAVIIAARIAREESRVRRAESQPKRVVALHAARATKQREAEVRKAKTMIRITKSGN